VSNQDRAAATHLLPHLPHFSPEAIQGQEASQELFGFGVCKQATRVNEKV
jgi:hypothetical protein